MNKLTIIGKLTTNPRGKMLCRSGPPCQVCDFTVTAKNTPGTTEFFRVSCMGGQAERCMKHLRRGSLVAVTGAISARAYLAGDGKPRASLEIKPDEIEILDTAEEDQP